MGVEARENQYNKRQFALFVYQAPKVLEGDIIYIIMGYYAFRIHDSSANELLKELKIGHLRQGWGCDPKQNLREKSTARQDKHARKNYPIKNRVHKDDFLLVINMPDKEHVTLAQATMNFSEGYIYDEKSLEGINDLGHIFPAKYIAEIPKSDLSDNIKRSLFCRRRFFGLQKHATELNELIVKYYKF